MHRLALAGLVLVVATGAQAQEVESKKLRVEVGTKTIVVRCDTHVDGHKGELLNFDCQLYLGETKVEGGHRRYTATPSYDESLWEDDTYELAKAPVVKSLGPGEHALTARLTISTQGGEVLAVNTAPFTLKVAGARPSPRSVTVAAPTVTETERAGETQVKVQTRIEARGHKGANLVFRCELHRGGALVPGMLATGKVVPKFKGTIWKDYRFHLSKERLVRALGPGRHQVVAVVSVRGPDGATLREARSAPHGVVVEGKAQPTPPAAPPPPATPPATPPAIPRATRVADPTRAPLVPQLQANLERLKSHPMSAPNLAYDPRLVGAWMTLTPLVVGSVLTDYAEGRREDLQGWAVVYTYRLDPTGAGELRETPLDLDLASGAIRRLRSRANPIRSWGVEVHPHQGVPYTLLRLEVRGGVERGLYLLDPEARVWSYTYFNDTSQTYHDQDLLWGRSLDFEALRARLAPTIARLAQQLRARRGQPQAEDTAAEVRRLLIEAIHEAALRSARS